MPIGAIQDERGLKTFIERLLSNTTGLVPTTAVSGLTDNLVDLAAAPSARVYNDANLTATTGVSLTLTFNSERFDTAALHDTTTNTNRLVAVTAGVYVITASIEWAANATGQRRIQIRNNVAANLAATFHDAAAAGATRQSVTTIYKLAQNDWVEATAFQDSGGNLDVVYTGLANQHSPEFSMTRIADG